MIITIFTICEKLNIQVYDIFCMFKVKLHFWNLEAGNVGEESLDIVALALFLATFNVS